MIVVIIFFWVAAVVILAGRGYKASWLAGLLAFPLIVAVLFALEPSFRGPGGRDYMLTGAVVAAVLWVMTGLASVVAWFIGKRMRS